MEDKIEDSNFVEVITEDNNSNSTQQQVVTKSNEVETLAVIENMKIILEEEEELHPEVFLTSEERRIRRNHDIRDGLMQNLMRDGNELPSDFKSIRLMNELLSAQEASIYNSVGARMKQKEQAKTDVFTDAAIELLKTIKEKEDDIIDTEPVEFKEGLKEDYELVPNQTDVGVIEIDPKDVLE